MKISILISSYNGEQYIREQLDSLRKQTRKPDEVIIADDCSTDHTVELAHEYINAHDLSNHWKVIVNRTNKGWQRNFFEGICLTTGDLVFFCDQDDVWFENKLEVYEKLFINDTSINTISGNEVLWDGTLKENIHIQSDNGRRILLDETGKDYLIHCSGCAMAIRRDYYEKVKKYYVNGWAHDDFFWKMGALDGSFLLLDDNVILHRIHGTNESRKKRTYQSTIVGVKNDINVATALLCRLKEEKYLDKDNKLSRLINHKLIGNKCREEMLVSRRIIKLPYIAIKYPDLYRRKRQIIGDALLVIKGEQLCTE